MSRTRQLKWSVRRQNKPQARRETPLKIVTILGSARKRGNTATVLEKFEDLIASVHEVERINITDYLVKGCLGCNACQKKIDVPGCVQKDDAVVILGRLLAANVIVYATPLYVWSFSAQMKALLDRQYCLVKWNEGNQSAHSLFAGKRTALLVTCGGTVEQDADMIQVTFDRAMAFAGCNVIGKYVVPNCTTPNQLGDKVESTAREMVKDIAGA